MRAGIMIGAGLLAIAAVAGALALGGGSSEPDTPAAPPSAEPGTEPEPAVEKPPPERPKRLTVAASGDILVHSPVYQRALANGGASSYDFGPMLAPLEPWVREADLALCHLETSLAPSLPPSGYPRFNTPPSIAKSIAATGWDACSTASNHSVDLGRTGVAETIATLNRAGIEHAGTYDSRRSSRRPELVRVGGVKVALLSYTTDLNGLLPPAPWSVNVATSPAPVLSEARRARARGADAVIVNMHWSSGIVPEYTHAPSAAQREFAALLARSRAITAVVGQGPHVVQPIERIHGKYVVFSEGNLISNQGAASGLSAASQDGLIAFLHLVVREDRARVERVRYLPVWVRHPDYAVLPAAGKAAPDARARVIGVVGRGDGIAPVRPGPQGSSQIDR